eukprot:Gregarina_sp_Poly_1__10793@NODE_82_length_15568_cov_98_251403_g70_i0_p10_GENE_NODE_82_length_15568_cov_98_251403_g70_i0NODE_82_length_15568_cov_98_251403_g70_i0_p10_ORF_typecomplete_len125_score18_66DUF863/PF05904_11/0_037tm_6/PF02949_20/0_038DUF5345/PF17280_2/0_23Atg14/PF10186_9/0_047MCU/PF04678_13/0_074MotA_ExbB/PF01618_16/0_13Herpes_US9/PF06072_11/0_2Urate_ox_N/PF06181_11/0_35_NODE_82_length_15568_cov_98_251403_g70_i054125786
MRVKQTSWRGKKTVKQRMDTTENSASTLNVERLKRERAGLEAQWHEEWKAKRKNEDKIRRKERRRRRRQDFLEFCFSALVWLGIFTATGVQVGGMLRVVMPTNVWFILKDDYNDNWDYREARWN